MRPRLPQAAQGAPQAAEAQAHPLPDSPAPDRAPGPPFRSPGEALGWASPGQRGRPPGRRGASGAGKAGEAPIAPLAPLSARLGGPPGGALLIDGHSQAYRALYSPGPPLRAPDGEPTRGTYFFLRILLQLLRERAPRYVAVAADSARKDLVRRRWSPAYKAKRDQAGEFDPALRIQLVRIYDLIEALGLPIVRARGWEADDVIASLVHQNRERPVRFTIVTQDKDLLQLVSKRATVFDPIRGEWKTPAYVRARWGVTPQQMRDYLSLAGDTSDGIAGVPGIGAKTAKNLIGSYGSLQGVYENREDLSDTMQRRLVDGRASMLLSRKLVRLKKDLAVPALKALRFDGPDFRRAAPLLRKLGFRLSDHGTLR